MASKIYIKGMKEPLIITDEQAKKLRDIYLDEKIKNTNVVSIGDSWVGTKGDIKGVWLDKEEKKTNARTTETYDSYLRFRLNIKNLPPEEKAKRTHIFELLFFGAGNPKDKLTQELLNKVIEKQTEFFALPENRYRIYPDFSVFAGLGCDSVSDPVAKIMTGAINQDRHLAKVELNNNFNPEVL